MHSLHALGYQRDSARVLDSFSVASSAGVAVYDDLGFTEDWHAAARASGCFI